MTKQNFIIPFLIEKNEIEEIDELAHWHHSFEFIEILEGEYQCHVSGKTFLAHPGDLCIINRSRIHRILNQKKERCRKKVLIFDPDYFIHNPEIYQKYVKPLQEETAFSHMQLKFKSGMGAELIHLIDEIDRLNSEKPVGYEMETIGLIYLLLRRLYLVHHQQEKLLQENYDLNSTIQRKMTLYIYEHYAEHLTLEKIAQAGLVSKSTCIRLFKEYTGKSPIDFLNRYRLEVSSQLLKNSHRSITDIAFECGFSQASYFNRQFKKEYGSSPNQYRQQKNHDHS